MTTFRIVRGGKNANSRRDQRVPAAKSAEALRLSDVVDEKDALAFSAACSAVDDKAFSPAPLEEGFSDRAARDYFLGIAADLARLSRGADLRIPQEFHSLLWMLVHLGADQKFIAQDQAVLPEAVSRWVSAAQTPGAERRRGIIASALLGFQTAVEAKSLVPQMTLSGRRAHVAASETPRPRQ